jgi:hypothetical protein
MARCAVSGARLASHGCDRGSGGIHAQRLWQRAGHCVSHDDDNKNGCLRVLARGGVAPCCRRACRRAPGATACAQSPPLGQARRIAGRVRRVAVMARRRRCTRDGGARLRRRAARTGAKGERSACEGTTRGVDQQPRAAYPASTTCAAGGQRSRHGRGVLRCRLTELLQRALKAATDSHRLAATAEARCGAATLQTRGASASAPAERGAAACVAAKKRAGATDLRRATTTGARRTCIFVAARAAVHPKERVTQEGRAARAIQARANAETAACPDTAMGTTLGPLLAGRALVSAAGGARRARPNSTGRAGDSSIGAALRLLTFARARARERNPQTRALRRRAVGRKPWRP